MIYFHFLFLLPYNLDYVDHYYFYSLLPLMAFNVTIKLVRKRIWSFGICCSIPQNREAEPCYRPTSIKDEYVDKLNYLIYPCA